MSAMLPLGMLLSFSDGAPVISLITVFDHSCVLFVCHPPPPSRLANPLTSSQECLRYNRLIAVMASSLSSVQKALKGLVVMSTELDEMGTSLFNQKVPAMWEVRGGRVLRSARRSCGLCTGGRVGR
jgi:hypothetical protein